MLLSSDVPLRLRMIGIWIYRLGDFIKRINTIDWKATTKKDQQLQRYNYNYSQMRRPEFLPSSLNEVQRFRNSSFRHVASPIVDMVPSFRDSKRPLFFR